MDKRSLTGLALLALVASHVPGSSLEAQERAVLSKEVAVARDEASLGLEFQDGEEVDISLRESSVFIDGEVVGSYSPGDGLDAAFRSLLGRAVSLDDGPLGEMLVEWSPPEGLAEDRRLLAARIDRTLEEAFSLPAQAVSDALADVGEVEVYVQEDVTIEAGRTVAGALLVVDADVRIAGTVDGDVVVVDGSLELLEGGEILGDVRLADADFTRTGGSLSGDVRQLTDGVRVTGADGRDTREFRDQIREEIRTELRNEVRDEFRNGGHDFDLGSGILAPFRGAFRAVGGLLENLVGILLLGLAGMGIIAFAPGNLDTVAETARKAPGRAWTVGMAGTFLLLPVYVLGMVALAISIVGIPVLIAWIPLFPLAAVAAAMLGYVAVARNVGEWLADSGYRYTDWIRRSNAVYTLFGGLLGLGAFFLAAAVLHVVPFSGFFRGLLTFAGVVVTVGAAMVGFGAVLLTRAGRRPEIHPLDPDEAWRRAVDPDVESELDFDDLDDTPSAGSAAGGAEDGPGGSRG